jgi:hypothetical protein
MNSASNDNRRSFDHVLAADLLGKYVLVGITKLDHEENLLEQIQYHGEVVVADERDGFCFKLRGAREGEFEWLPPDTRAFELAPPGEYRLYSTSEVVADPDYTTTWTSRSAPSV